METLFILALLAASVSGVTIIIERAIALRRERVIPGPVAGAVNNASVAELRQVCQQHPSALSRILIFAADHLSWPRSQTLELIQTRARHEVSKLEQNLFILEILVGVAPLLGLVGTVYGLIGLFGQLNMAVTTENANFAKGISHALGATLGGLIIAIPALIAWSFFNRRVETLTVELEGLCDDFLRKHQGGDNGK